VRLQKSAVLKANFNFAIALGKLLGEHNNLWPEWAQASNYRRQKSKSEQVGIG